MIKNCWKWLRCWKARSYLVAESTRYRPQILITQIEVLNKSDVKILRLYLWSFPRNRPWKNVMVLSGRFIVLDDSANPKMIMTIYFNFFRLFFNGFKPVWMLSRWLMYKLSVSLGSYCIQSIYEGKSKGTLWFSFFTEIKRVNFQYELKFNMLIICDIICKWYTSLERRIPFAC